MDYNGIVGKRELAQVGDKILFTLTDEHRTDYEGSWATGTVTKVARKYLTVNNLYEFSIERGYRREERGFTSPGKCAGWEEHYAIINRTFLRRLGTHVENLTDYPAIERIAGILGLKLPDLQR